MAIRGTFLVLGIMLMHTALLAQRIQNTSNGALSAVLPFGTLTPGVSNIPSSTSVQFRLRNNAAAGYHVEVSSVSFNAIPSAAADGGDPITPADIGVGITSITPAPTFNGILPRNDIVTSGFNYDPSAVSGVNGLTPYTGMASGLGTLADLANNPNITIITGNRIHANMAAAGARNYLTVTMTFALLRQYFTPAAFSGVVTLRIFNGP